MKPSLLDLPPTQERVAICLVCDAGYAFPTAVVAESIARMEGPWLGPVYFVWADDPPPPDELVAFLAKAGVRLARVPDRLLDPLGGVSLRHWSRGALGRLFLSQALEREPIGRFIYLDGDLEITGSLDRLAAIPLDTGQIATADDVRGVVFKKPHLEAQLREERRRLGMPESAAYFNTGVMLADMHAWAGISEEALKVFLADPAACINLDQCAINAVCYDRRRVLSPRWNFQSPYFDLALEDEIQPCIVHFTGPHKPWRPIPFTRTWPARKPFFAARGRMPQLWKVTQPQALRVGYYSKALKLRFRFAVSRDERRREVFDYLARTSFADEPGFEIPQT